MLANFDIVCTAAASCRLVSVLLELDVSLSVRKPTELSVLSDSVSPEVLFFFYFSPHLISFSQQNVVS